MNKKILKYIEQCEGWKVGIKNLHWSADNMSQHELCDDIASEISDFEDLVSEVEQSISGKIKLNGFTPKTYKIASLKSFVEDVISASQDFLKELDGMGKKYIGIKSECETFIGTMQRKLYLVNFTLKEELKRRLRNRINEGYRKEENIKTVFRGTKPSSDVGIMKRLDAISSSKNGQFNSRLFDGMDDAFEFYQRNLENIGSLHSNGKNGDIEIVTLDAINGKSYNGMIDFVELDDGKYKASIKFSNIGKETEEFDDDEMNLETEEETDMNKSEKWFRHSNGQVKEGRQLRLSESELKDFLRESVIKSLRSLREMNELYQEWYDEEDYDGNVGEEGMIRSYDIGTYYVGQAEEDARENGYDDVADYLEYWFSEIQSECPWYWQKVGSGYGYNGTTIFKNDGIVCKDIYGQIMIDEYPIGDARRDVQYESRKKVHALNETPLNYDIDNFSGRWNKSEPSDEELALADSAANGDYLDNPFNPPNSWDDDEWVDGDKDMENDYSWDLYHRMNNVGKSPVDRQHDIMDAAQNRRDHAAYWTDRDNERGNRLMSKWVDGKRDLDDLENADFSYDPYKYNESKEPIKVTESELMGVLRESVMNVLEDIDIDPKNKGKFTKTQKETGKSTEELCHSKNPLTRKRANFAKMAKRGWKPLKESIIDNVISGVIEEGLEDSPVQAIIDGKVMKFKNPREAKKFLKKRQLEKERQKAIEKGKDPSKVKVRGSKKPKAKQQGIASQSDPKSLAKEIRNFIYDKSLKSINVFVSHSERSYGPNVVRSLVNLYRENSESNLFNDFNVKYREINKFVDEIENWGSNNEYAVYERCSRLSNSIKDLCEILSNLANTTQMLKNSGKLEQFKTGERNVLVGSTDGKELGLFNLIFAKGARVLGNFESKLYKIADLLSDISKNGRDPFDYKI